MALQMPPLLWRGGAQWPNGRDCKCSIECLDDLAGSGVASCALGLMARRGQGECRFKLWVLASGRLAFRACVASIKIIGMRVSGAALWAISVDASHNNTRIDLLAPWPIATQRISPGSAA